MCTDAAMPGTTPPLFSTSPGPKGTSLPTRCLSAAPMMVATVGRRPGHTAGHGQPLTLTSLCNAKSTLNNDMNSGEKALSTGRTGFVGHLSAS